MSISFFWNGPRSLRDCYTEIIMSDERKPQQAEDAAEQSVSPDAVEIEQIGPGLYIVKNSPAPVWDTDYFASPKWIPRVKKEHIS